MVVWEHTNISKKEYQLIFLISHRRTPKSSSALGPSLGGSNKPSRHQSQHGATPPPPPQQPKAEMKEAGCQTLSTGDIVITKIFFKEEQDKKPEKTLTSSGSAKRNGLDGTEILVQQQQQNSVRA